MTKEYEINPVQVRIGDILSNHVLGPGRIVLEYPQTVQQGLQFKTKFNIHYFDDGIEVDKQYQSDDGVTTDHIIKPGYSHRVFPQTPQKKDNGN